MREGLGDVSRATRGSVRRVAAGCSVQPRTEMLPGLHGHRLQYYAQKKPQIYELRNDDKEFVCL
jgi:hypothetical protein